MKKITSILFIIILLGCSENRTKKTDTDYLINKEIKTSQKTIEKKIYQIKLDDNKVSKFTIENSEIGNTKALIKNLSDYTTKELTDLPNSKRLTMNITIPFDISKESLENTLKSIVKEKTENDNDIDEIIIFAYDDKSDIGKIQYTYGKLLWSPNGKLGDITPRIAKNNIRDNYKFDIDIKEKVGNIEKTDIPSQKELAIYNMMMDDKYLDLSEDKLYKLVMNKFKIKSKKEVERIYLKVGVYKLF